MRKLLLIFISAVLILPAYGQKDEADKLIKKALPNNEHGLAILITQGDDVVYEKYVGYADVKAKREVDANTTFRIGSVTKQFTAAGILKLVEQGEIKLDDPLSKFIKDFPQGEKVTIHHLLTHTSGIKSYTDEEGFLEKVNKPITADDLANHIKTLGYDFEPGDKWKYNNSAYFLLGYIIEQESGMSYGEFLNKHFFKPAEMNNTGIYDNSKSYKREALGYMSENGKVKESLNWDMSHAGGAGNMYSTVSDLIKWNEFVFSEKALSNEVLKKAHTPVMLNDGSSHPYGYGWGVGHFRGQKQIAHSGGLHGFLSFLGYYPEIGASIAITSNASPPLNVVPANLAQELVQVFFNEHLKKHVEVEMTPDELQKYIGRYEYPRGVIMTVTNEDDKLFAELSGQPKFQIFPEGDHTFFWKAVDAQITFHVTDEGVVDYGTHKQGIGELKVPKMEEQKEIKVSSKDFERFAGEYDLNGKWLNVWEEKGHFYAQIQGQPKFEIFAKSANRFFLKAMAAEIEFAEGKKAESLTIFQSGQEIKANRK